MEPVLAVLILILVVKVWHRSALIEQDIRDLRQQIDALKRAKPLPSPTPVASAGIWPAARAEVTEPSPIATPAPELPAPAPTAQTETIFSETPWRPVDVPSASGRDFEFNFGKKLPVWIGGVALAFAGFYLVKYSIDMGLLTPAVRITLGFIFGLAMLAAGGYIRARMPNMADGTRIAQALTGAGIADLYATTFAATTMLHLIEPQFGFFAMALITALAVILSVRHGMPIAILGLLGGFLTPALIQTGHPNAAGLFIYLLMLVAGFFTVITMLAWWILAIPVLLLAFLWVPVWIFTDFHPEDGIWLSLFLLSVGAIAMIASAKGTKSSDARSIGASPAAVDWGRWLGYAAMAGCVVLMSVVVGCSDFALEDLGLYAVLGAGCVALAWFRPRQYGLAPWLSMIATLCVLAIWNNATDETYAWVLLGFALLYNAGGFFLLRAAPSLKAAGLLSTAALGFYGLGYLRLDEKIYTLLSLEHSDVLHLWGILAITLAGGFTLLTVQFLRRFRGEDGLRQQILALTALTATAFLSLALTIEVRHEFLAVAFAAETLAVCWINLKVEIKALRKIAAVLFGVFLMLMSQQLILLAAIAINSLFGGTIHFARNHLMLATDPMFQLGLPMMLIGAAARLLQRQRDGKLPEVFEMATVGLGALLVYYLARRLFGVPDDVLFHKATFFQRGIITNLFFAAGLAVVCCGREYTRRALVWSGTALFAMALFRVFWFDLLTANPLFASVDVGAGFLINSLVLPYLLPCFWLWLEERPQLRLATISPALRGGIMLVLLFTFISLNVRQLFHGSILTEGPTENAEIYAYSIAWLILGGVLLFFGTLRQDKPMRSASLVIMILTIGKVFLYDASQLTGLYRVFSFMGLGLSLLALSWFYSRFVFKDKQ